MDRDRVQGGIRESDPVPQDVALVDLPQVDCRRIAEQGGRYDDDGPSGGRVGVEDAEEVVRRHGLGELVEMSFPANSRAFLSFFLRSSWS